MSDFAIQAPQATACQSITQIAAPSHQKPQISLQAAFESLDISHIRALLEEGADPYQTLEINPMLAFALIKKEMSLHFDREDTIESFTSVELDEVEGLDQLPEMYQEGIEKFRDVQQRLNDDEATVSDKELIDMASTLNKMEMYAADAPSSYPEFPAMGVALLLLDISLLKSFVEAGFDFTKTGVIDSLVGHRYQIVVLDPETGDALTRLNVEHAPGQPGGIKESVEELLEGEEYKQILEIIQQQRDDGKSVQLVHQNSAIFGLVDVMDIEVIIDTQSEIVDFLLDQKVMPEHIFQLTETFHQDLVYLDDPQAVIEFLNERGFLDLGEINLGDADLEDDVNDISWEAV